jgi:hypothetical protein
MNTHSQHDLCVLMDAQVEYSVVEGVIDADDFHVVEDQTSFNLFGTVWCNTCRVEIPEATINHDWQILLPEVA